MEILLSFVAGVILASIFSWIKNKPIFAHFTDARKNLEKEKEELKNELDNTKKELSNAQREIGQATRIAKENEELKSTNITLLAQRQALETEKVQLTEREKHLQEKQTTLDDYFKRLTEQQKELFDKQKIESENVFNKISENKRMALAEENRQFTDKVKEFTEKIRDFQGKSKEYYDNLERNINETLKLNNKLSDEANKLTNALKNNKIQGNWGESVLENILTAAGMTEGRDFKKQPHFSKAEGTYSAPDFIIHLPKNRDLVIDVKTSLDAFKNWVNTPEGPEKQQFLKQHIQSVEKHIDNLSGKDYHKLGEKAKLDFTFMFIPIEYAYFAALSEKPNLNEFANQKHVVITTASNLFCLLRIINNLWEAENRTKTIEKFLEYARHFQTRVKDFTKTMGEIRTQIDKLSNTYEAARIKLLGTDGEHSILISARHLEEQYEKIVKEKNKKNKEQQALDADEFISLPEPTPENLLPQEENSSSGVQ